MTSPDPWHPSDAIAARHHAKHPQDVDDCVTCALCDLHDSLTNLRTRILASLDSLDAEFARQREAASHTSPEAP